MAILSEPRNGGEAPATKGHYANGSPENALAGIVGTAFRSRTLRVVMLGAGWASVSGIQFTHDITTKMKDVELDIYEKNAGIGGAWYENRYPGCACDVPAHTYQFSWEPNPYWTKFYAPAPEICAYLNKVVDKHDLRKHMHFRHRAIHAEWQERSATWQLKFEVTDAAGQTSYLDRECDVLVSGVGTLNNWKYPDIEGLSQFKGSLMHTATWDDSVDLKGKTVAVIGNGASAVQLVPALQPVTGKIYNYVRTASWMLPHLFSDGAVQKDYSAELQARFESDPHFYFEYRRELEQNMARGFEGLWRGTQAQADLRRATTLHMEKMIADARILHFLTPEFEIGCRRFTPGDHYLHALQQDNVHMLTDHITRVTETGISDTTGVTRDVDAIVCATGFETSYEPRFPILGRNGYSLAEDWGKDKTTESYMGAMVARLPNFFVFNPPICPVIGSAFPGIEAASSYMIRVMERLQHDSIRSLSVKSEAQAGFNEWAQSRMAEMVFTGNCKSWYKNSKGKVFIPWPGTIAHYIQCIDTIRWEDFHFVWANPGNKYSSFGNGVPLGGVAPEVPPWLTKPETVAAKVGAKGAQ
ncbi:uncharacterized protein A1O9_00536 [Exophiala aquamarina CBS 119918]|uniref:Uncharacterized protein n=1 Tax=Exophiala aquamarina CBS 119918 TaxID=1182545 RepID=A0A072PT86_9EURO|nr:uncharacterized protein A1O9_00536 [Exophiala aquamarina CBS 119918]KEF62563.1 hypothetical protein A1O9_00536 [Exophiala aquamarina CBS 119918]